MNRDPITTALAIRLHRVMNYLFISLLLSAVLWLALLLTIRGQPIISPYAADWRAIAVDLQGTITGLASTTWEAMHGHSSTSILLWNCVALGCSLTLNLFLLIGRWWRRRGEVTFRRGARMLDTRELGGQ